MRACARFLFSMTCLSHLFLADWTHTVRAQDELSAAEQKAIVQDLYNKCQPAKTIDDFTAAIELCNDTPRENLSESRQNYIDRLTAFLLNKRGELFAARAGGPSSDGNSEEAAELDRKAMADFESALKKDGNHWKAHHNRGVSFASIGKLQEAIDDFSFVLKAKPDYVNDWFNRGEAYYALGEFEKAIRDFYRVLRLSPRDTDANSRRGHAKFQLERFDEALADFDIVVARQSSNASARADRADAYQSLGRWQSAANDYRRAISLDEDLGRAYQSAAWLMATCPREQYRNPVRAMEAAEKAIELGGESNYQVLDTLAAAQANRAMYDDAVATIEKAIDLAHESARDPLNFRLKLYEDERPYRQGMYQAQTSDR